MNTTIIKGIVRYKEPMSRHTSWRVGGIADQFYLPESIEDLVNYIAQLPIETKLYWLGLGSNLLIRDAGIRGAVICTNGVLNTIEFMSQNRVRVEVGVACPKFAKKNSQHGNMGAEFLCGIPGTIGGALCMNAGAFGGSTWDVVEHVEMIDRNGILRVRSVDEFEIGYRHVCGIGFELGKEEWFVAAVFQLQHDNQKQAQQKMKQLLAHRAATQPTQQANAGSVFRNPQGDYAASLIEKCGLKGFCIGGACVSDKHANFIVNTGTASAADIELLIQHIHDTVFDKKSIKLQQEVRIVGDITGE